MWQVRTTVTMLTALATAAFPLALAIAVPGRLQTHDENTLATRDTDVPAMHLAPRWAHAVIQARAAGRQANILEDSPKAHAEEKTPKTKASGPSTEAHAPGDDKWVLNESDIKCGITTVGCFGTRTLWTKKPQKFDTEKEATAHSEESVPMHVSHCSEAVGADGTGCFGRAGTKKAKAELHLQTSNPEDPGAIVTVKKKWGNWEHTCGFTKRPSTVRGCWFRSTKWPSPYPDSTPSSPVHTKTAQQ